MKNKNSIYEKKLPKLEYFKRQAAGARDVLDFNIPAYLHKPSKELSKEVTKYKTRLKYYRSRLENPNLNRDGRKKLWGSCFNEAREETNNLYHLADHSGR